MSNLDELKAEWFEFGRMSGLKEAEERIIKLLEEHAVSVDEGGGCWCNCGKGFMRDWDYNEHLLTVINKGDK
jgi:hypothetical protein